MHGALDDDVFLPLQDHGFFRRRAALLQRAVPFGVRVTNRLVGRTQLGHYVVDPETWGDVIGPYHWPAAPVAAIPGALPGLPVAAQGALRDAAQTAGTFVRTRGAWASAWPAVVQGGQAGGGTQARVDPTAARQGLRGAGVAPVDAVGAKGFSLGPFGLQGAPAVLGAVGAGIFGGFGGIKDAPPPVRGVQNAFGGWAGAKDAPAGDVRGARGFGGFGGIQGLASAAGAAVAGAAASALVTGASATRAREAVSLLPIWSDQYDPDRRFRAARALLADDRRYPSGTVGIVLDSVRETQQDTLFFPSDGKLVAVNYAGDPATASLVYDLDAQDRPDPARRARLHSMVRVVRPGAGGRAKFSGANALAWQLGRAGQDGLEGLGLCADHTERALTVVPGAAAQALGIVAQGGATTSVGPASRVILAAFGAAARGPLEVGDRKDKHRIGTTRDGEPILAGHLATQAFYRGGIGDGPLEFQDEKYSSPRRLPFRTRVHLRWDEREAYDFFGTELKGIWRWEAETFFGFPPRIPITDPPPPWVPPNKPPPPVITTPPGVPGKPPPPNIPTTPPVPGVPFRPTGEIPGLIVGTSSPLFHRRVAGESAESPLLGVIPVGVPALLAQAAHPFPFTVPDLRRWSDWESGHAEARLRAWRDYRVSRTPISARLEAFCRVVPNTGEPLYQQRPGQGRYTGGTAAGGFVFMPAERDIADYVAPGSAAAQEPSSEACWVFAPGTFLAFGNPSITTSDCVVAGWEIGLGTGASVTDITINRTTGNTAGLVRIAGARVKTAEGPLFGTRTSTAGAYTATAEDQVILGDTSGGTFAITLPAASLNDGRILFLKNVGNNIANTLNVAANDYIGVGTTKLIGRGDGAAVVSDGTDWWHLPIN